MDQEIKEDSKIWNAWETVELSSLKCLFKWSLSREGGKRELTFGWVYYMSDGLPGSHSILFHISSTELFKVSTNFSSFRDEKNGSSGVLYNLTRVTQLTHFGIQIRIQRNLSLESVFFFFLNQKYLMWLIFLIVIHDRSKYLITMCLPKLIFLYTVLPVVVPNSVIGADICAFPYVLTQKRLRLFHTFWPKIFGSDYSVFLQYVHQDVELSCRYSHGCVNW